MGQALVADMVVVDTVLAETAMVDLVVVDLMAVDSEEMDLVAESVEEMGVDLRAALITVLPILSVVW